MNYFRGMKQKKTEKAAERQFLELLKTGLWGGPADLRPFGEAGKPDWKGIMHLARTQAVLPLIYDGIQELPQEYRPEGAVLMKLIAYVDRVEMHNRALDAAAVEISGRLASQGIPSVLLKGQGNAVWYRNPLHRQCGDIDLYVGPGNFGRAAGLIRGWKEISDEKPESIKHIGFSFGGLILELHREAFYFPRKKDNDVYRPWETRELAREGFTVTLGEGEKAGTIRVPPPDFNLFYIFCHAFHHFMQSGLGLRQLCDIACLLHACHGSLDTGAFRERLEAFRLDREWKLFAGILVDKLGLPAGEAPMYDPGCGKDAEKLLSNIFSDGNFGHHSALPDFSRCPVPLRKIGNLGIHHIMLARRLGITRRQTLRYYAYMWSEGLKHLFR